MDRNKISSKYKWNLTSLYNPKFEKEYYSKIKNYVKDLCKLKGKISDSYENLKLYLKISQELNEICARIGAYYYNKESEDLTNSKLSAKLMQFSSYVQKETEKLCWIEQEIIQNKSKIEKLLTNDLQDYKTYFERIFRYKNHILSSESEKIVSQLSECLSGYQDIFGKITSSDFKFGKIKDSKNKSHILTQGNYNSLFHSDDVLLRKNAYNTFWSKYTDFKNTLATNYYYSILSSEKISSIYKFDSCLAHNMYANNLSINLYDNLLIACKNNNNLFLKWNELKMKIINNNDPAPWDLSRPLFKMSNKKYTIEQAHKIIIDALKPFGKNYEKNIKYILNNKCIDYFPNMGKRQGAYSYSVWNNIPYICMNWNGKYLDLSTLAHELGHSIHSVFSNKNQPYQYHNYPIFLAEIASIVNELMLANYLLTQSKNVEMKKTILEKIISEFFATVNRQLQFAEYEKWAHNRIINGETLDITVIEKKCIELNNLYFPKSKSQTYSDDFAGLWGIFVPHFYRDFYVYQYSIGMICACIIVYKINNDKTYYKKYIDFLSNGRRDFPLDILLKIDINLEDQNTLKFAFKYLNSLIDTLSELQYKNSHNH